MITSYQIKKIIKSTTDNIQHVLLLNGSDKVFETSCIGEATKLCQFLNGKSGENKRYEIVTINYK
jgi:hypothetical protein